MGLTSTMFVFTKKIQRNEIIKNVNNTYVFTVDVVKTNKYNINKSSIDYHLHLCFIEVLLCHILYNVSDS